MGQLLLANNMVKEGLAQGIRAYSRLMEADDPEKVAECLELIGRCYELTGMWVEYAKFTD